MVGLTVAKDFPFFEYGGDHLATLLGSRIGGSPAASILRDSEVSYRFTEIIDRLMPYRCGKVDKPKSYGDGALVLTEEEVKWYEFQQSGMYIIVDGFIYDVSGE